MPVRRILNNRSVGYGSFGNVSLLPIADIVYSIGDELDLVRPFLPQTASDGGTPFAWAVYVHWRWKFSVIQAAPGSLQIYNVRSGKTRYGVCVAESFGYASSEDYVCFSPQISKLHQTAFVLLDSGGQDILPCDEPPSDTQIPVVVTPRWYTKSANFGPGYFAAIPVTSDAILADKVTFYPEIGVQSHIFGGSYTYFVVDTLSQTQYEVDFVRPPVINL